MHPAPLSHDIPATLLLIEHASVPAGFPSPAEDHAQKRIDLNDVLIRHPQATFMLRVSGHSMTGAGLEDGDAIIVDRAITPRHGHIVVAIYQDEFCVKRLYRRAGRVKLQSANPTYPDIEPREGETITIWGVVTSLVRQLKI